MAIPALLQERPDFSLVLGGPVYQLFRRSHLSGDGLELLHRRIVVIVLVAWLPLLLLSMAGGHLLAGTVNLSFLHDVEGQVRLLVALPVLIAAELMVHSRIRPVVQAFLVRRIVLPRDVPRFLAAIDSASRLRNSIPVELGLLVFVCTVGQWIWRSQVALGTLTWYAIPQGDHFQLTAAGYWYAFVSIPIFQFILLRWYLRFFIWFRFLWQVSRLNLHLITTHPDRAGGLGFLGKSAYAFSPILFAQGTLLAGVIASRVLYGGESFVVLQDGSRQLDWFLPGVHPRPTHHVYAANGEVRSARGWPNTACWQTAMWMDSSRNGWWRTRQKAMNYWAPATFSRWPIWGTVTPP